MIFSESNQEISKALVVAWSELKNPKHNAKVSVRTKQGGQYTFEYTDLGGILEEAKAVLGKHQISIHQNAYTTDGFVTVETMFLHSSGEWMKSSPLQVKANADMKELGGQITYMKRYSLSAMLGIATEEDDDGNLGSGDTATQKLTQAQVNRLFAIGRSAGVSDADIKKAVVQDYKKARAEDLTKKEYDELCARLEKAKK